MAATDPSSDGIAYIQSILQEYGFNPSDAAQLSQWAKGELVKGSSPTIIRQQLWEQPAFRTRFKVIFDRQAANLPPISPAEVIAYERSATQLFRGAGLPSGFYDSPDDFHNLLLSDVSLAELNSRVDMAKTVMYQTDPTVRAEMKRLYGLSDGQEAAYILDPTRALPIIQNQFNAAQTAASSVKSGYGELSLEEANQLGALGISPTTATNSFGQLVNSRELFAPLPGEEQSASAITRAQQLSAAFSGDALAQERIRRRAEQRVAAFGGQEAFAQTGQGIVGVGTANT